MAPAGAGTHQSVQAGASSCCGSLLRVVGSETSSETTLGDRASSPALGKCFWLATSLENLCERRKGFYEVRGHKSLPFPGSNADPAQNNTLALYILERAFKKKHIDKNREIKHIK